MDRTSLLLSVFVAAALACFFKWLLQRFSRGLPPGPWGLPLLGYGPFLSNEPYKDYLSMKKKYGGIYGFYIGSKYMVILNDFEDIKEAFNKEEFLDRPDWFQMSEEKPNNVLAMNGWEWRENRRFILSTLRTLGMGKNQVEEAIKEEIVNLSERLERMGPDADINIFQTTFQHFLNIILTMICGNSYENSEKLLSIMNDYGEAKMDHVMNNKRSVFYPYLRPFLWIKKQLTFKRKFALYRMKDFIRNEVEKHEKEFNDSNIDDFISYYLNEMQSKKDQVTSITRTNLTGNAEILLFAATDTTRTTTSWIFLYLAHYQEAQEMMYQEIVGLLGKERPPSWEDRDDLPFTNAFILETARVVTIVPAEDPKVASREGTIRGYHIPKGTIILANVKSVHVDPRLWGDPENFRPERFLSRDGKKAVVPDYWIPFLTGKRMCPGEKLAKMQLFLIVSSIVQKYRILPPKSGLSLDVHFHLFNYPKKPLLSFRKRS